jgi:peptidyl-dipeptidase A
MKTRLTTLVLCGFLTTGINLANAAMTIQERADRFLELVNSGYQAISKVENEAQWRAVTDVKPEHDSAAEVAGKARAAFTGNPTLIREAKELLKHKNSLKPITVRQLQRALLIAAEAPMTNPELAAARIEAEVKQASLLNSFEFKLKGKLITPNEIDNLLQTNINLGARLDVWKASKEIGPALKQDWLNCGTCETALLRTWVCGLFALQSASYDTTTEEMLKLQEDFIEGTAPAYLQIHTYVKYELAKRYNQPVPKLIPAHWINNRWAQNWTGIVPAAADLDDRFKDKTPEWIVQCSEQFWKGLGFPSLPESFWKLSDLYPVKPGENRKKNTHASCWHIDLDKDIRSLMSVEPNSQWFETAHHELGHAYYDLSYSRPEVPMLLRTSANPAFHEGIAEFASLASWQPSYLKSLGVLPPEMEIDQLQFLLNDAIANSVPFIYWASGTMTHWEADIYANNLDPNQWNARWWKYVREFQGVEPPEPRGEEFCDPATKTHINDAPCYYFSYPTATVIRFQLVDYICKNILKRPPQDANYANSKEAGKFLRSLMEKGATEDWRQLLKKTTGEGLSTRAMLEYFKPLTKWLEETK